MEKLFERHDIYLTLVPRAEHAFVAADGIDSASMGKIPLWAFGFLY